MNKWTKTMVGACISVLLLTATCVACSSTNPAINGIARGDHPDSDPNSSLVVNISGEISHDTYTNGQTGTITFSRFPTTLAEFKHVRDQIGAEPHGAVALEIMAFEMFRRNKDVGSACIDLNSTTTFATNCKTQLKRSLEVCPYMLAAYLQGTTPDNGYNPSEPYTIEIKVDDAIEYEYSSIYQCNVLALVIRCSGKGSEWQKVSVICTAKPGEPSKKKYFIVMSGGGLLSKVQEVSFENPFQGLK